MYIYFLLVSIFLSTLRRPPLKHVRSFFIRLKYLFFVSFLPVLHQLYLQCSSNEENENVIRLRLAIKNNVRYVTAHTYIERLMKLQRSCQQMVTSVFFFFLFS